MGTWGLARGSADGGARCPSRDRPALPGCPRLIRAAGAPRSHLFWEPGFGGLVSAPSSFKGCLFSCLQDQCSPPNPAIRGLPLPFFPELKMAAGGPRTALRADAWCAMRKSRGRRLRTVPFFGPNARPLLLTGKPGIAWNWAVFVLRAAFTNLASSWSA